MTSRCPRCGHSCIPTATGLCCSCRDYTRARNPLDTPSRDLYGHDMYFDRNGVPITLREFYRLSNDLGYRRIAEDIIGDYQVETVWRGLNRNWLDPAHPLIFETRVSLSGIAVTRHFHRYFTEDEARAGHEALCAEIRVARQDARVRHPSSGGAP